MSRYPYRLDGPAVVSFSGGRTSGCTLKGHCPDMRLFHIDREPYATLFDQAERQGVLALSDPTMLKIGRESEDCVCTARVSRPDWALHRSGGPGAQPQEQTHATPTY